MLVGFDKFTKWIEAKPVTTTEATTTMNFMESIIFHFGVPPSIITDIGSNFTEGEFKEFYDNLGIQLKFSSVVHPQTNEVKKANGLI
jgi:transposase InsO family protein